ncbi:thiolase family protein [Aeromonas caviae]
MRSAVIVSTARTPIGKAVRGAFNATKAPTLGALSLREAVIRAGIDPAEVDDVVFDILPHLRASRLRRGIPITG